jgi:hypothetical protein
MALVTLAWIGAVEMWKRAPRDAVPVLLVTMLSVMVLALYRALSPYASNNGFRYIFPVIVPLALFISESARAHRAAAWLIVAYCVVSAVFYSTV